MTALRLDHGSARLFHVRLGLFDPHARAWQSEPAEGEPIELRDAVRWLQAESGHPCRPPIGVIGPREATADQLDFAERLGRGLAEMRLTVICGGLVGTMSAVARGAYEAGGTVVGLLPEGDWRAANPYVTIPIATGLGLARNAVIARASLCLVAAGSGYGTLSEMAFGLQFGVPVFGFLPATPLPGVQLVASAAEALDGVARVVLNLPAEAK